MRRHPSVRRRPRRLWSQLRDELTGRIAERRAEWSRLRRNANTLDRFDDPFALLAWFRDSSADLDLKDAAYRELLRSDERRDAASRSLARDVAWLGLWPALDRFVRRDVSGGLDAAAVAADYTAAFLTVVERFESARVNRVAATVVRNTARTVADARAREALRPVPALASPLSFVAADVVTEFEVSVLRLELSHHVGDDADLILMSVVFGMTCEEIAARASLSAAAVNKRLLRAMHRLRRLRATANTFLSDSARSNGVSLYMKQNFIARCPNHWPPSHRPLATKFVGTSMYCTECADFLLAGNVRHLRGSSCIVSDEEGSAICPACLVDVYRARGELP